MAASTSVESRGPGGSRRRVGREKRPGGRGPGGDRAGTLKRLKLAVEEFVQAFSEGQPPRGREGPLAERSARPGGRRNRRELKKEKRRLKKARRLQRTAGPAQGPGGGAEAASGHQAEGAKGSGGQTSPPRRAPRPPQASPPPPAPAKAKASRAKNSPAKAKAKAAPARAAPRGTRPSAAASAARKRALLAANEEEDREIRKLERCLGLNKRRRKGDASSVPLSFARDGLDYILGALGSGDGSGLYDSSSEEEGDPGQTARESDGESVSGGGSDSKSDAVDGSDRESIAGDGSDSDSDARDGSDRESISGDGSDDDSDARDRSGEQEDEQEQEDVQKKKGKQGGEGSAKGKRRTKRVRFAEDEGRPENPPEDADAAQQRPSDDSEKYVPPHVRRAEEAVDAQKQEERQRLQKQVQGLINRLSEPNLASISGQLEELYMRHSRRDVSDTLTRAILSACAPDWAAPGRLVMEHVLLVSVLHRTVGIEVGAHFLEAVVRRFDGAYRAGGAGKECDNLLTVLAHLYGFRVVQCPLVFDLLRRLVGAFSEKDVELALLLLRTVGFVLRKDDALALKELIAEAQAKAQAARADGRFQDQTRVRFMLETMLALRNNDVRKIPGYDPEPAERLRKLQGALVRGTGSGTDSQLRVSWDSVLNAPQTGRWWIVGSAWSGTPMIDSSQHKAPQEPPAGTVSAKMLELARKQRMNTDVRRSIFCTIMSSEDFLDAFEKLLKLGLKDQQEREVVHVLVDCCLQERSYNPFYAFLASKLCSYERRFQMTFQFSIWDKFRDLENLPATSSSNLVHLVAHLLKTKSLPLSILKVVEFSELDKPRVHFLRSVLYMLLMETEAEDLGVIFARVSDNPKLGMLREGLKLFIGHFLLKGAQAPRSPEEASALRERAELSTRALQGRAALRM
ncbi:nucleolar MIF4G domain-containing protein 1 isoform X2 [Phyllostomus hastatus]|uniref:nucleolar MIF4G domain-containing protein 1 isoform X2 n=1 Tax=Phyllostomus hastatus TaxID=9423 RepID=UPI001E68591A|nr:nucleolar MIF4G domain-containing protein 1 isoform X2 [Phyllostomus hastatus]